MLELSKSVNSCRQLRRFNYQRFLAFVTSLDVQVVEDTRLGPRIPIGSGAYATVYSSTLLGHPDRPVAIKCAEATLSFDDERIEAENVSTVLSTITQELRITAHSTLKSHPNIPKILGVVFESDGHDAVRPILVMELAQGTLSAIVTPSMPWPERLGLARDAVDGLVALHAHNIVHGDVKGDNILVFNREGNRVAALSDLDHAGPKDDINFIVGTTAFYAPECFPENEHYEFSKNGCSRDVYSFGLVLLALATCGNIIDKQARLRSVPEDVRSEHIKSLIPTDTPGGFFDLVYSCLAKDATRRPSALDISITLSQLLGETRPDLGLPRDGENVHLLDSADTPRLRYFRQNPISPHLAAKLFVEHLQASTSSPTVRECIGLAAFYMGIYGEVFKPQADKSVQATAVAQWLMKAVERGSYSALILIHCEPFWSMLMDSKGQLLFANHQSFESPSFDIIRLRQRLQSFKVAQRYAEDLLQILESSHSLAPESPTHDPVVDNQGIRQLDASDHFDVVDILASGSRLLLMANTDNVAQFTSIANADLPSINELYLAMFIAVSSGSLNVVRYLVEDKKIPVNSRYRDSWINEAIWWAQPDILQYLLEMGAAVDQSDTFPPLHRAMIRDNPRLAKLLCAHLQKRGCLDETFRSVAPYFDVTPLSNAIALGAYKVAQEYILFGAVPDGTISGLPVLHMTLWPRKGFTPMSLLRLIIKKCPFDILNTPLAGRARPIEIAVTTGNLAATYFLLMAGVDINNSAPGLAWKLLQDAEERKSDAHRIPFVDEEGQEIIGDNEEAYFQIRQLINHVIWRRLFRSTTHETSAVQNEIAGKFSEDDLEEHLDEELEALPTYLLNKVWNYGPIPSRQFFVPP